MSALPAESPHENPRDPRVILAQLPDEDERSAFLRQYREALDAARDPDGWEELSRVLRLWHGHILMMRQPGYREARERARRPETGTWLSLDQALAHARSTR